MIFDLFLAFMAGMLWGASALIVFEMWEADNRELFD